MADTKPYGSNGVVEPVRASVGGVPIEALFNNDKVLNDLIDKRSFTTVVTDPGNAGAIAVTSSGSVSIVTAGAETRTLAAPLFLGQQLAITMKTDGGDCVITSATTINQTGNNTITLNDAGDTIILVSKFNGSGLRWTVLVNDGASLSTVP